MSFRVRVAPDANRRIQSWALPDPIRVEVGLRLQRLQENPADQLHRVEEPFDGLVLYFDQVDPTNRLREFHFIFDCVYSQDEQTVIVVGGICIRHFLY